MKGSQMEEDEGREEKEEKIWRLKPIAFQVNSMLLIHFDCPIILALIQDPDQETHVVKIWDCYGKDSQVWILIFLPICASLHPKIYLQITSGEGSPAGERREGSEESLFQQFAD